MVRGISKMIEFLTWKFMVSTISLGAAALLILFSASTRAGLVAAFFSASAGLGQFNNNYKSVISSGLSLSNSIVYFQPLLSKIFANSAIRFFCFYGHGSGVLFSAQFCLLFTIKYFCLVFTDELLKG
jgi:hypothetical protein